LDLGRPIAPQAEFKAAANHPAPARLASTQAGTRILIVAPQIVICEEAIKAAGRCLQREIIPRVGSTALHVPHRPIGRTRDNADAAWNGGNVLDFGEKAVVLFEVISSGYWIITNFAIAHDRRKFTAEAVRVIALEVGEAVFPFDAENQPPVDLSIVAGLETAEHPNRVSLAKGLRPAEVKRARFLDVGPSTTVPARAQVSADIKPGPVVDRLR